MSLGSKKFHRENLALFFFLGVILVDYLVIGLRFEEFYTDRGAYPLSLARTRNLLVYYLQDFGAALLSQAGVAYLQLLISIFASFILGPRKLFLSLILLSLFILQFRNIWILDGGDSFTIFFLYWVLLFINSSARAKPRLQYLFGLQLAFIYICNGLLKSGPSWSEAGTALKIIWSQPYISYPWINQLVEGIDLKWLTLGGLYLERTLPVLLIFRKYKWAALFFISYHLVIFATVRIDFFALINVASWLLLLYPVHAESQQGESSLKDRLCLGIASVILLSGLAQFSSTYFFDKKIPVSVGMFLSASRLNQDWRMFTPDPRFTSYQYRFHCWVNGQELLCPESIRELEQVENWGRRRKQFMIKMAEKKYGDKLHHSFHEFLCRQYPLLERITITLEARILDITDLSKRTHRELPWPETAQVCRPSGNVF